MYARPADVERQAMAVVPRALGFQPHEGKRGLRDGRFLLPFAVAAVRPVSAALHPSRRD
jgi:hypothetical protein